jgi:MoaA/NifB/PqqE/SkfB family radical SAM enzyme
MASTAHEERRVLELITAPLGAQLRTLAEWGLPRAGLLLLMNACENRCFFCANEGVLSPPPSAITQWSAVRPWLEQNRVERAETLCVVGTEPALHADFDRALSLAQDVGFRELEVMTSGLQLAVPGAAARWAERGVRRVCVPLYASEPALHDAVVGRPAAFERTLRGLEGAARVGIEVRVHTLALRRTEAALPALARFVRDTFSTRLSIAPVRPKEAVFDYPREAEAFDAFERALAPIEDVGLVGFPLCVAPDRPRDAALTMQLYFRGQATSFAPECAKCSVQSTCPGIALAELSRTRVHPR